MALNSHVVRETDISYFESNSCTANGLLYRGDSECD